MKPPPHDRLVFLGPPGSGKGTQAEILSAKLGVPAISTGDMLRAAVAAGSTLGERVDAIMRRGALVDDETMAEVVRERLAADDVNGFILDGYPRTVDQAETLHGIVDGDLHAVLLFDVPEEELIRRTLARRREDDEEEVIRRRLEVYHRETEPLVDYYGRRDLLRRIDGHRTIDEVARLVEGAVGGAG